MVCSDPLMDQAVVGGITMIIRGEQELRKHLREVSIYEARSHTEKIFKQVSEKKTLEKWSSYYAWALHDIFFYKTVSPYLELRLLMDLASNGTSITCIDIPAKYASILQQFSGFKVEQSKSFWSIITTIMLPFFNCFLLFYSFCSYLIYLPKRNIIGVWTGDYLGTQGQGDPRITEIYTYLNHEKIPYLEFIRTTAVSPRKIIQNMIRRRKAAIYMDSLEGLFQSKKSLVTIDAKGSVNNHLEKLLINLSGHCEKYQRASTIFDFIFRTLKFKTLICWFLSHRTFSIITAAKKNKIKTIGFMHGVSVYSYMGHEYMKEYRGPAIGPDKFGVWSEYWLKQFQQHSSIYAEGALEISGPMNKSIFYEKNNSSKEFVTIISEQSSDPQYIIHFIQAALAHHYKVLLKVRPFGADPFYLKLQQFYPDIIKKITVSFSPVEEVFNLSSVVLGTHSTAVIEASKFLVPFALLSTKKWQDYFDIKQTSSPYQAYLEKEEDLINLLQSIKQNDYSDYLKSIRNNYFGAANGLDWIKKQINE